MLKVLILKSYLFVLWMMLEKVLMYVMFIFVQPLIILYYWYYPIICCKLFLLIFKTCIITLFYSEEIKIWMYFILYTKNKNKNKKTKRKRGILWTAFYKHFLQGCVCVYIYIFFNLFIYQNSIVSFDHFIIKSIQRYCCGSIICFL